MTTAPRFTVVTDAPAGGSVDAAATADKLYTALRQSWAARMAAAGIPTDEQVYFLRAAASVAADELRAVRASASDDIATATAQQLALARLAADLEQARDGEVGQRVMGGAKGTAALRGALDGLLASPTAKAATPQRDPLYRQLVGAGVEAGFAAAVAERLAQLDGGRR